MTLIDFPQMVSTAHANAADLYERDVACVERFFAKKLGYLPSRDPAAPLPPPAFEARPLARLPPMQPSSSCLFRPVMPPRGREGENGRHSLDHA